jgi:predicted O-methyltransferase YrrM
MLEAYRPTPPAAFPAIEQETKSLGFTMASDLWTGMLLRVLAGTKQAGRFLELGTGTGLATSWLLDGMDDVSRLTTIDTDETVVSVARRYLGHDPRVTFVIADAGQQLGRLADEGRRFDLIFADALPGKYTHLDEALRVLDVGGLYVIDDMLPQPNWPPEHPPKVAALVETLAARTDLRLASLQWSTGLVLAIKIA